MTKRGRALQRLLTPTVRDGMVAVITASALLACYGGSMMLRKTEPILAYSPAGITTPWIPPTVRQWNAIVQEMAQRYDIDANLVAIIITMESGGDASAKSGVGATGLMQIMPATAGDIAGKYLKKPVETYNLSDPRTNIEFGTAYLAWLRDQFGTAQQAPDYTRTVELIAAGYNGGPGTAGALERGEGLRDIQPVTYSRDAFNMWRERVSATSPTFDRWKERGGNDLLTAAEQRK